MYGEQGNNRLPSRKVYCQSYFDYACFSSCSLDPHLWLSDPQWEEAPAGILLVLTSLSTQDCLLRVSALRTATERSFDKRQDDADVSMNGSRSFQLYCEEEEDVPESVKVKKTTKIVRMLEEDVTKLENDLSTLSLSPQKFQLMDEVPLKFNVKNRGRAEDFALLAELYPELDIKPSELIAGKFGGKSKTPKNGTSECKKTNVELSQLIVKAVPPKAEVKPTSTPSDFDSDSDDAFEKYLKSLRNTAPVQKPPVSQGPRLSDFLVSDDDVESDESSIEDDEDVESDADVFSESSDESFTQEALHIQAKGSYKPLKNSDDDAHFLISLSLKYNGHRHADAVQYTRSEKLRGDKSRRLTEKLVEIFIRRCFVQEMASLTRVQWNPRLRKTAGMCKNHRTGESTIELSTKVCDTAERVRDTLLHELCHAAVWTVDKLHKEGHGPGWKRWALRCMKTFKSLPLIERCHNYEIAAKYAYVCIKCKQTIKRQSKSLDVKTKVCGICGGRFELYRNNIQNGTQNPAAQSGRAVSGFALFVKENYAQHKATRVKHADVMRVLSIEYKSRNSGGSSSSN